MNADSIKIEGSFPYIPLGSGRFLVIPGQYNITVLKSGYLPFQKTVSVAYSKDARVNYQLREAPGVITVSGIPVSATLYIADQEYTHNAGSSSEIQLVSGDYPMRIFADCYLPLQQQLSVKGFGAKQHHKVSLKKDCASISIDSNPSGAKVILNGTVLEGKTTPTEVLLPYGEQHLSVLLPGFISIGKTMQLSHDNAFETLFFDLKQNQNAAVRATSTPSGARIILNGTSVGFTPTVLSIAPNKTHTVQFSKPNFVTATRKMQLKIREEKNLHINLSPQYGVIEFEITPQDANLIIDGKVQSSSQIKKRLVVAPHQIEIKKPGHATVRKILTPSAQEVKIVRVTLKPTSNKNKTPDSIKTVSGYVLRLIKPTAFIMGPLPVEKGKRSNEFVQEILMEKSFYMGVVEVSNQQYRKFKPNFSASSHDMDDDNFPVVNVSWEDAAEYLNWLSQQDKLPSFYVRQDKTWIARTDKARTGYRLPSEAEWDFVARVVDSQKNRIYPWGDDFVPVKQAVANLAGDETIGLSNKIISGYKDGYVKLAPIGSFQPTPLGIFNLGGNVSEWCHDFYDAVFSSTTNIDPLGPQYGVFRVIRGANWKTGRLERLRAAYRRYGEKPQDSLGFRIVRYVD